MAVRDDIRQHYPALSPALQQVARFVLEHPNDVVTASMRAVGTRAGSPPATLVRFAQMLGFDGWIPFKEAFAQDMGLGSDAAYGQRARALVGRVHDQELVGETFEVHRHNLQATQARLGDALHQVCALLEAARNVHVAGFRASYPVAFSFVYVYRLLRASVHLLDGQGGTLEMQCRAMEHGDALLVVAFAPYSREALAVAQAAKEAGCRIVALTDSPASPLALLADATLLFSLESPSFFPSITSAVALSEALVELLASRSGKDVVQRIDQAESQLFASGAYLQAPRQRQGS